MQIWEGELGRFVDHMYTLEDLFEGWLDIVTCARRHVTM